MTRVLTNRLHTGSLLCLTQAILWTAGANAQAPLLLNQNTPEICFQSPTFIDGRPPVPGLNGAPSWPAPGVTPGAGSQLREEAHEPRWGKAPITGFLYEGNVVESGEQSTSEFARWRLMVNDARDRLYVQISMRDDSAPDGTDKVFFGIANEAGTIANGVEISPVADAGATGKHLDPQAASILGYAFNRSACLDDVDPLDGLIDDWQNCWSDVANPTWIEDYGLWNDDDRANNAGAWVISFVVKLTDLGFTASSKARITMGANVAELSFADLGCDPFSDPNCRLPITPYATDNVINGCSTTAGVTGQACVKYGPFFWNPASWTRTHSFDNSATEDLVCRTGGVSIGKTQIGTKYGEGTSTANAGLVRTSANELNDFFIRPTYPPGLSVSTGAMEAQLRIANWGTVADPQTGWFAIANGRAGFPGTSDSLVTSSLNQAELAFGCQNGATGVCGLNLNTSIHQCMQAQLIPTGTEQIRFSQSSTYRNMYFVPSSEIRERAEINTLGLSSIVGSNVDIYFHVVTTNMPVVTSTPMTDDVDALESLREQIDPTYDSPAADYCDTPGDLCVPLDGSSTRCIFPSPTNYYGCANLPSLVLGNTVYCVRSETCDVPPGGGYDPALTGMTPSDVLTQYYPTLIVFPYYDSGETYELHGVQRPRFVPMPSFGLHISHRGEFFGWLKTITAGGLRQTSPDWYKLSNAPTEARIPLDVHVSSEEKKLANFVGITGNALNYSSLFEPAASVSGTGDYSGALDLRKATVTVEGVLVQNGKELVKNFVGPRTLAVQPGATDCLATFASNTAPRVTVQIIDVPFVGLVTSLKVYNTSVTRPTGCPQWGFGAATLDTAFTVQQTGLPPVSIKGRDVWACIPLSLSNPL
jgi:hypothetical protein